MESKNDLSLTQTSLRIESNSIFLGIIFCFVIAAVATFLGKLAPLIGAPVIGIVIGIVVNNSLGVPVITIPGIKFTSKKILQAAIIILGGSLSINQVWQVGLSSLSVMIFTLAAAFITSYAFGKILNVNSKITSLIGTGTAICGGSAIAAVSPIILANELEIAYSISTIFFFNIIGVLVFPLFGHLLGFSDYAFGLWVGTAINDTSSVVAAGYAFSNDAGAYATIVKLTRVTMIIPVSLIFAFSVALQQRKQAVKGSAVNYSFVKVFPWFVLWFVLASFLNSFGVFKGQTIFYISWLSKFLIVMALTAIGLNTNFRQMLKIGYKPLLLGFITWVVVSITSIIVQYFTGKF